MNERDISTGSDIAPQSTLVGVNASHDYVQRRTQDGVAILSFAGPDGNRMNMGLIQDLDRAIARALGDDGVRALVLTARGPDFCAGPSADLPPPGPASFVAPETLGALCDLCLRIEDSAKPVVCALHGHVASGGLAVALAAQARVGDTRATLQFPDLRLGLLPPGNGAVRLAWQLGASDTLDMVLNASPRGAPELRALFTRLTDEALLPVAIDLAGRLAQRSRPPRSRPGLNDGVGFRREILAQETAETLASKGAGRGALETIEAAQLLPPDQALAFDLVRAQELAAAPEARALAHLTRATRRALDTPETRRPDLAPLRAGPTLLALSPERTARLAPNLLRAGSQVVLVGTLHDPYCAQALNAELDKMDPGSERDFMKSLVQVVPDLDAAPLPAIALCDMSQLAAVETGLPSEVPVAVWNPEANPLLALTHPDRLIEIMPAPTRPERLCELVVHAQTRAETVHEATQLMTRLRLTPLRVGAVAALPRLIRALALAARRLRALGVSQSDLAHIEILPQALAQGDSAPSPTPLPLSPERLITLAVINAGAHLLEDGVSLRPSDIDLSMVLGAGWPNTRGGPMAEADTIGPMVIRRELDEAARLDPELWSPAAMFDELVRQGWRFEDLNTG